jgi:hypothetical protein
VSIYAIFRSNLQKLQNLKVFVKPCFLANPFDFQTAIWHLHVLYLCLWVDAFGLNVGGCQVNLFFKIQKYEVFTFRCREMREMTTLRHFEEFKKMLTVSILFTEAINAIIWYWVSIK